MSRALGEEVTWDDQKVTSVDWRTYRSLSARLRRARRSRRVLINRPDGEAMGAGETAITVVAAAIGNAIFDATGARIRAGAVHARAGEGGASESFPVRVKSQEKAVLDRSAFACR